MPRCWRDAGTTVRMWGRRQEVVDQINAGSTRTTCPGSALPQGISATATVHEAVEGADIVVLAVPRRPFAPTSLRGSWTSRSPAAVVSLMKGVELGTTKRMSEVVAEAGGVDPARVVVVSGPNLAREIVLKQPAASVVACADESAADLVAHACPPPTSARTRRPMSWASRSVAR